MNDNMNMDMNIDAQKQQASDTRRWIRAALMVLLGLYFLDNAISGRITFYVNQNFIWLAWFGGFSFLLLGAVNIVELVRERNSHDKTKIKQGKNNNPPRLDLVALAFNSGRRPAPSWFALAVIAIPAALGILVPGKPLSANAINTSGISTYSNAAPAIIQLTIAPEKRNVLDWVRSFSGSQDLDEFTGQPVDIIGFVYRSPEYAQETQFMVARFALVCCVADASALGVVAQTKDAMSYAQDSWVHVTGKMNVTTRLSDGQKMPVVIVDRITRIDQPDHPYLYP